jgi:transposase
MTDDLEDLKRRLVVGYKRDGRSVYGEAAKSASVSRLARECGVNANQVGRWLREHGQLRGRKAIAIAAPASAAFVEMPVIPAASAPAGRDDSALPAMTLQARLPNDVAMDLGGVDARSIGEVIEAFGRLRCSA